MKAALSLRPLFAPWARAFLRKCTRQCCHEVESTRATAALMPSWASEMTSSTPERPRATSLRRNSVQKVAASEGPTSSPSTSRWPSALTPMAKIAATETTRPCRCTLSQVASIQT